MKQSVKVLLIGGTSHVGKSTLAKRLADELGWNYLSTDQLARHPGRPWRDYATAVPDDVIHHYSSLSATELVSAVLSHYRQNVWPIVAAIVRSHVNNPYDSSLVFEGSAILPDLYVASQFPRTRGVWLTAEADLITSRIRSASRFASRMPETRQLIDAFLARTLAFDEMMMDSVESHGQPSLDASSPQAFDVLASLCRAPDRVK